MSRHLVADLPARLVRQLEDEAAAEGEPELGLPVPDRPAEPRPDGPTSTRTQVEVIRATLEHELSTRPDLVILGEDVAIEGGVFRATKDLHLKFGLERVIDTPLSENGIVGAAVGMAMAGLRPVVEIMFAGFSYIGIDQVIGHVGRMRWRTRGQVSLPLVIRMPAGGGFASPVEFHSDSPEAMFVHNPGLTVVYPSTAYDAKGLLASAIASDDPVIVFEPILRNHLPEDGVPDEHYTVPIGVAAVRRPGRDLTVVTYGNGVAASLDAADLLADEGIELEVIDLRTLYPFDEDSVLASVRRTGRLLTVHEAALTAGLGAEIAATVAEQALEYLDAPVARVGHADTFWHPGAELESFSMVTPSRIAAAARRIVRGG
nr:alpha-ketoacid dehydrogenase subunit beta [Nocardioides thalensis]